MFHFGMTGDLRYASRDEIYQKHDRVVFSFSNGHYLAYKSQRKFGKLSLTDSPESFMKQKKFGPDAVLSSFDEF